MNEPPDPLPGELPLVFNTRGNRGGAGAPEQRQCLEKVCMCHDVCMIIHYIYKIIHYTKDNLYMLHASLFCGLFRTAVQIHYNGSVALGCIPPVSAVD